MCLRLLVCLYVCNLYDRVGAMCEDIGPCVDGGASRVP